MAATDQQRVNLNPAEWGPSTWTFLFSVAQSYPEGIPPEDQTYIRSLLSVMPHVLPCAKCRSHFAEHLRVEPLTDAVLASRARLLQWLGDYKAAVDRQKGAPPPQAPPDPPSSASAARTLSPSPPPPPPPPPPPTVVFHAGLVACAFLLWWLWLRSSGSAPGR